MNLSLRKMIFVDSFKKSCWDLVYIATNNSKNGSFVNKENNDSANIDEKPKTTINRDYRCSKPPVSATTKREILNKSLGRIDISSTKNIEKNLSSRTPIFKKPQYEGLADKYVNRIKNSFNRTLYPSSVIIFVM